MLVTICLSIAAAVTDANTADPNSTPGTSPSNKSSGAAWETIITIWQGFVAHMPLLIAGVLLLAVTWVFATLFHKSAFRMLNRLDLKESQQTLISRLINIAIWIIGILIAAMVVFPGLTPAKALAGLGIGSIAVGFAFKDIFENFFAGLLILWRFPFETGDYIQCKEVEGKVVEVTIRNTCIRRVSGELVVVPNSTIFKNSVDVLTYENLRRNMIIAGVAYGENVDESREVIRRAVQDCNTVSKDKPIEIFAREFASSSINFEVAWWTKPEPLDMRQSRDEVVAAVKDALDSADIEIPFPYRTLVFKKPIELSRRKK